MNNKHDIKIIMFCSCSIQTNLPKLREKKVSTYSFTFIAKVFVKSAKLK